MDPSRGTRKGEGELSDEDNALIAQRRRVWQVRKYCQVRPSMVQFSPGGSDSGKDDGTTASLHGSNETADPALAALLRGVVRQLDADIVMISLLDEHTQYFLSGATGGNINDPEISLESAQWYGCDVVSPHGGLCERTITLAHQPGAPAFYEELDMKKTERTQTLPYVNGITADFRHYVGMPITSPDGINIGTVFAMSRSPAENHISETQQQYLYQTTKHVMRQLVQAVQALEGKRAERYNEALSALLNDRANEHGQVQEPRDHAAAPEGPVEVNDVYRAAGEQLHEFFDLSGLVFQELSLSTRHSFRHSRDEDEIPRDTVITGKLDPGIETVVPLDASAVTKLLDAFPNGGVLHVDDSGEVPVFAGAINYDTSVLDTATNASLNRSFPRARQIIFTPLWHAIHNRNTALCVGWVLGDDRIYRPETDLNAMSSFCMATISMILRIESQKLDRIKSDFIGSISHETRSPLHNVLGNLDLALATTDCSPRLREMLMDARFGATQLLETIDKILLHSGVQGQAAAGPAYQPLDLSSDDFPPQQDEVQDRSHVVQIGQRFGEEYSTSDDTSLVDLCEEIVEDVAKRMRLSDTILSSPIEQRAEPNLENNNIQDVFRNNDEFSIIIFDARSSDNCQVKKNSALRIILENLLSNAIKFSESRYCVRSSLRMDRDYCYLDVIDSGRGFSKDFIKHSLFVPFSQQEPVDSGMGLGLSLVKRNVERLEGNVRFETDETIGSKAIVTLPLPSLSAGVDQKPQDDYLGQGGTAVIPPMLIRDRSKLPVLKASVYFPKWFGQDDKRGERSIRLLHGSLASTLEAWFQPRITIWHQGQDEGLPHLVFIAHPDLESFEKSSGEAFADVKKIVVCADVGKNSDQDARKIDAASDVADAIITGSILPSKLWKAVTLCFPQIIPTKDNGRERQTFNADDVDPGNDDSLAAGDANGSHTGSAADVEEIDHRCGSSGSEIPIRTGRPTQDTRHDSKYVGDPDSTRGNPVSIKSPHAQSNPGADEFEASAAKHDSDADNRLRNTQKISIANVQNQAPTEEEDAHLAVNEEDTRAGESTEEQRFSRSDQKSPRLATQPKVLLVDDNNINLKMLTMFVRKCGIDTSNFAQAAGGQQAIDLYAEAASSEAPGFDIIFMDLSMPEVSGFDATSAIRRLEDSRGGERSHIVALTGLVSDKDRRAAKNAGTDEYITKPAGLKTVQDVIDKWRSDVRKATSAR